MKLKRLFTLMFVLYPILDIYGIGIPGFSIGKIVLVLIGGILCIRERFSIKLYDNVFFTTLLIFLLISSLINLATVWFSVPDFIHKLFGVVFFYLILCFALQYADFNTLVEYYRKSVYICVAFFLAQYIIFLVSGKHIVGLIPFLSLSGEVSMSTMITILRSINRFSSFFLEPAHFAVYVSCYLIISAFRTKDPFSNLEFIFLSLVILLIKSGNGYIVMSLVYVVIIFRFLFYGKYRTFKNLSIIIIICSLGVLSFYSFSNSNNALFQQSFARINELSTDQDNELGSSGYQRIYSGYFFIDQLPIQNRLYGLGLGEQNAYFRSHDMHNYRTHISSNTRFVYLNNVQLIWSWGGIIALFLYFISLNSIFIRNSEMGKMQMLVLIITSFISSSIFGPSMLFYMIFAIMSQKNYKANKI